MKNILCSLLFFLFAISGYSQQTIYGSIIHDGIQREYILYIPAIYNGTNQVPLVMNFHGLGSNATEQMYYGDFRSIADTAGFLIVHPEGTLYNGVSHWNVGGWTIGSTVDDIGFTAALIDSLSVEYMIDSTRIYATGMSNGGFMSFLLGCQLNNRIAAIGSVTGSMTPETYAECSPVGTLPVLQIHGTADPIVPYNGASYTKPIDDVLDYWVNHNSCDPIPLVTSLPDIDPNDGSTVELFVYPDGDDGVTVEHYKVIGGAHTWPGNPIGGTGTNYDINASAEIWKFFARYDIFGLMGTTGIRPTEAHYNEFVIYPNPCGEKFEIRSLEFEVEGLYLEIFDLNGRSMLAKMIPAGSSTHEIDVSGFSSGIYFVKVQSGDGIGVRKIVMK